MNTIKTLYFKDKSKKEAKLEILRWGEEYCPLIGEFVYSESRNIIFLITEEEINEALKIADAVYFTDIQNYAIDVTKWEDIRI